LLRFREHRFNFSPILVRLLAEVHCNACVADSWRRAADRAFPGGKGGRWRARIVPICLQMLQNGCGGLYNAGLSQIDIPCLSSTRKTLYEQKPL
jgi:hypothetical protein